MKLDNHISDDKKAKLEISIQKKQEVEKFLFTGRLKPQPHQRVFKIDLSSGAVSEVKFFAKSNTIHYEDVINGNYARRDKDILIEEGFDYIIKLNIENAIKHFKKAWKHIEIEISEDHESNVLIKKQGKVNKYTNK